MTTTRTLALLLLALLPACNGGGSGGVPRQVPIFNVSGTWSGSWSLPPSVIFPAGESGSLVVDLSEDAEGNVAGSVALGNSQCFPDPFAVLGTIAWPQITLQATNGSMDLHATVTDPRTIQGSWRVLTGPCAGQQGVALVSR